MELYEKKIIKLGYEVDQKIISPIDFNVPQTRDRMYIVAKKNKLNGFVWPNKLKPKNNLKNYLSKDPVNVKKVTEKKDLAIKTWKYFLSKIPKNEYLPNPLWSMEFGATYPFKETTPKAMKLKDLRKYKGKFGVSFENMNRDEILNNLPNYSKVNTNKFPDWKIRMIRRTREFYEKNKKWIDKFLPKIIELEFEAYQKLEWNCQGDNFNLRKKIVSFRGSGVRIKRNNNSPTLVSGTLSQVPYLPWKKRYLSHEECLNIQGFKGIKSYPKGHEDFYAAIGNAVNVEVVSKIAKNLLS